MGEKATKIASIVQLEVVVKKHNIEKRLLTYRHCRRRDSAWWTLWLVEVTNVVETRVVDDEGGRPLLQATPSRRVGAASSRCSTMQICRAAGSSLGPRGARCSHSRSSQSSRRQTLNCLPNVQALYILCACASTIPL
jgi:hypothetical protein